MRQLRLIPEKYLLLAMQACVGFSFVLPLITNSDFYFPFIVPRNIIFRLIVALMVVVYALLVAQNRKYLVRKNVAWILLLAFAAALTVSSLFGVNIRQSFWSSYERMDGLIALYHLIAYFFILLGVFRTRAMWDRLFQISIFVALVVALVGFSQILGVNLLLASSGGQRIASTLGNATYLAAYLSVHFFLILYFLIKQKTGDELWFYKYGFIGLDLLILYFHFTFGTGEGGATFIGQVVSNWIFVVLFFGLQIGTLAHLLYRKNERHLRLATYVFYSVTGALFLALISTTQTRGALVGLAMGVVFAYIAFMFRRRENPKIRMAASSLVVFAVLAVGSIFVFKESQVIRSQPILSKIASISLTDRTTFTRLASWEAGLRGSAEHPILGWGVENYQVVFNKFFPTVIYVDEGTPLWFDRPHNVLIQYLAEGGVVGLALFLALLAVLIYQLLRKRHDGYLGILFSAFLVAYVGQNLFVFDSINSTVSLYAVLAFIVYLITDRSSAEEPERSQGFGFNTSVVAVVGAVVLMGVSAWLFAIRPARANMAFVEAYRAQSNGNFSAEASGDAIGVIAETGYLGKAELIGALSEYLVDLLQQRSVPDYELAPVIESLLNEYRAHAKIEQTDARFNLFHMNLLLNAERINREYLDELLAIGEQTVVLSPDRPQVYYMTGRAHMIRKERDEGLADFLKAVELAPNVFDSHWNLFAAYVTVGDLEGADRELARLKEIADFEPIDHSRTASVFAAASQFALAERELREAVARYPEEAGLYAQLADVYASQGRNAEARDAVVRAVALDPSLQAESEQFLDLLENGDLLRVGQ